MKWVSVNDERPAKDTTVIVAYFENGHYRCVLAEYVPAKSREVDFDTCGEFNGETWDEETEIDWWPAGWYECPQNNAGDESQYWQSDYPVTYWMPLPKMPV